MAKMKAAQIAKAGADFEIVDREADGGGSGAGPARGDARSVDLRNAEHSGLGVGNSDRFGGYATICGADGRATDDREVSAGASGRSVRADDEREGAVSRRPDDVTLPQRRCRRSER